MDFVSMGWVKQLGTGGAKAFSPADLAGLVLWCQFNTGITEAGAGVSVWADQSGNGNDLLQGVDANRPQKQGDGSILFNGTDEFLKAAAFTWNQPATIYLLGKQPTWSDNDIVYDGNVANGARLRKEASSPDIDLYCGGAVVVGPNSDWTVDTYAVIAVVLSAAASSIQINDGTPDTANPGTNAIAGFTLGSRADGAANYAHIQAKAVIGYNTAHDAATRTQVINYLNSL